MGSALLAAYGVGIVKDLAEGAARWVKTGAVTQPDPKRGKIARARLARYRELLEALNRWSEGKR
jgi:sugar (pentulose or hexulose) kinase